MCLNYQFHLKLSLLISLWLAVVSGGALANQATNSTSQVLVSIDWLIKHQDDEKLVIVDARNKNEFKKGHINGAINIPVATTFNQKTKTDRVGNLKYITALFRRTGIRNDHTIILYDDNSYVDAGRVFWVFEVYGHKNVKLLNGGIKGWQIKSKQPLSQADTALAESNYVPTINSQRLVTKFSMQLAVVDENKLVIDTRKKEEFDGYKSIATRFGHIPNARNIPWTDNFVEIDGVKMLKPLDELRKMYSEAKKNQRVILYCNKGKHSSLSYTVMRQLGYDAAHYDGSWYEWGNDVDLPIIGKK